jgi:DNA-directed RNA polymerase specialized sigma24 family protein
MDLSRIISYVSAATARAYPQVTREDVAQQLQLHAHDNLSRFFDYMQREDGERIIRSILNQEARKYAIKERAHVTGHSVEDQTWYSPRQIREILPDVFDYADWQSFQAGTSEVRVKPVANATGDRLASIIDVKNALEKMLPEQAAWLKLHYHHGEGHEALAHRAGISQDAARKRLDRAVYALRDQLGGPRPADPYEAVNGQFDTRSKGRRAMSNAAARRATEGNW